MRSFTKPSVIVLTLVVLTVATTPVIASPSIFGPSGLLRVPNADTLAPPGLEFGGYWSDNIATTLSMNVGVLPEVELSAAWVDPAGGSSAMVISGKWQLWDEKVSQPALAVGIYDASNEINATAFAVAQKHFLVGNTKVRVVAGFGENNSLVEGLFAGAEIYLGKGYSALVEYDGDNTNAGLRWPLRSGLELTAAVASNELTAGARWTIY